MIPLRALVFATALLLAASPGWTQNSGRTHELFPYLGFYAPDRFENSFSIGVRYEHHFDRRLSLGGSIGFASAKQDFFQKAVNIKPEQGSSTVIYYNGRLTHAFPFGPVVPYLVVGLGVTRQHSESNLTFTVGFGTKFPVGKRTFLRYEFNDHIFSSGQDNTAWTNNNLEFSAGISFYLR